MNEMVPGLLAVVLLAVMALLLSGAYQRPSDSSLQDHSPCEKRDRKETGSHAFERRDKRWPDDFLDLSGGMLGI